MTIIKPAISAYVVFLTPIVIFIVFFMWVGYQSGQQITAVVVVMASLGLLAFLFIYKKSIVLDGRQLAIRSLINIKHFDLDDISKMEFIFGRPKTSNKLHGYLTKRIGFFLSITGREPGSKEFVVNVKAFDRRSLRDFIEALRKANVNVVVDDIFSSSVVSGS